MTTRENLSAARIAFEAVETAIQKAMEATELLRKCRSVPGTTIMTQVYSYGDERFVCHECGEEEHRVHGWKFCPNCGNEIVRFERKPVEGTPLIVTVHQEEPLTSKRSSRKREGR